MTIFDRFEAFTSIIQRKIAACKEKLSKIDISNIDLCFFFKSLFKYHKLEKKIAIAVIIIIIT